MSPITPGRYRATPQHPLALFLIGMRIHRPLRIRTWWPAFTAMTRMLRQLESDPELGLLAATLSYTPHPLLIQYWRSPDHLDRFARDPELSHRPAWQAFNQLTAATTDVVGLWHEIYVVTPDTTRSLYRNMPRTGLAEALAQLDVETSVIPAPSGAPVGAHR